MATSESEVSVIVKKTCKYCKKNVTTGLTCELCDATYHHSCAQRIKTCCDQTLQEKAKLPHNDTYTEQTFLKEENTLLKQIIKDKDTIIKDKETLIVLLNNRILNLEEQLKLGKEDSKKQNKNTMPPILAKNIDDNCNTDKTKKIPTKQQNNENKKQTNLETLQNKQTSTRNYTKEESNTAELQKKQLEIMQNIINLENLERKNDQNLIKNNESATSAINNSNAKKMSVKQADEKNKDQPTYSDVSKRRKIKTALQFGDGGADEDFEGVQKRIWIFVSRVKLQVTAEKIKNYLISKPLMKDRTVVVEELQLRRTGTKAFKVGLDYALKDDAYSPNFWPKGVGFSRYTFPKNKQDDDRKQHWDQQSNIQENFPTSRETGSVMNQNETKK